MLGLVIPAAGRGSRFGSSENKIWASVGGRPLLEWTLDAFQGHPSIDCIVLVGGAGELDRLREAAVRFSKVHAVVPGGASRQESVGCGLAALPAECDLVLVHDAARPAVPAVVIDRVVAAVTEHGAAVPGLPVADTVKRVSEGVVQQTVPRDGLWAVQTPQGARKADLLAAYEQLGPDVALATDEGSVLERAGYPVWMVEGDVRNVKVTRPDDLEQVERALGAAPRAAETRTGMGYDVHPFEAGRDLWLGGVKIPHDCGLKGHSDADALLHAVCDALLGAAALGDIGVLFPDTDARHKDRPSIEFVREVRNRLDQEGWRTVNVDVMLLAEAPRVGPYRPQMVSVLADGLGIAPTQVNIKATTSEKMGFVGRREGIACWAVATIVRS